MRITIIGAGYVGLVTGACIADHGHDVICIDVDTTKVDMINNKQSPLYEKDLDTLLKKNQITATTNYEHALQNREMIILCVGTPAQKDNNQDLSYIQSACEQIGTYLQKNQTIIVKSSVVPGTTETILIPLLEKTSKLTEGKDFHMIVNPEFLREGNAVYDFLHPDRIIIGYNSTEARKILEQLYQGFTCPKLFTTRTTAEMIKYASNAFLALKVSYINEIGNLCKHLNIDVYAVADGIGYDQRIGRAFLDAGVGWGGSCFPKDVQALIKKAEDLRETPHILQSVIDVNDAQPEKLLTLLYKHLPKAKRKTIGILGCAFKPDTDDIRDSRAIPIIQKLLKQKALVKLYDPQAMQNMKKIYPDITYCTNAEEVLNSDAILILTKWKEFENLNYKGKLVVDGRRITKAQQEAQIYEGIGW
jgi:UDPglucose 6-dehydrogenase